MSWQWRDGTLWDFEAWDVGQPNNYDDKPFLGIKWEPSIGVVWAEQPDVSGVICMAPSPSAIRGAIPLISRLGGPKNAAIIATSKDP
jgi:hypothetical protein